MFKLVIFALALAVASANWAVFKAKYNKTYLGDEDVIRHYIWENNMRKIEQHNELYAQGKSTYYMGENQFTDMTNEEFVRVMNGLRLDQEPKPGNYVSGRYAAVLPTTVDWRTKGYVTPVKDQGRCGSCWAFSTTGSLEGQHFKSSRKLVSLSESNLVDCSFKEGNYGCAGGNVMKAFRYIINNRGIDTEASYPYKPENGTCAFKRSGVGATVNSYQLIKSGSEDALQKAVAKIGPVSVAIDAGHESFRSYSGGIYNEPACSSTQLEHAVLVVGYGTENGQDYWLVKNSWGTRWGLKGYIKMSRNKNNQCGIASVAIYPIV